MDGTSVVPPSDTGALQDLKPLDPSAVKAWTIKLMLVGAVVVLAALVYDVTNLFGQDSTLPPGIASGAALIVSIVAALTFPRLWYRYWRYELRDEVLFVQRGIVNRVHTVVPLRRIQHLDVSQDIIEREFDLGKLIVHTAGTRSSDVVLPGLSFDEAERLRNELKDFILEDTI